MNDTYHFNLKSEEQEYRFHIIAAKRANSDTITVGGRHYAVVPENPLDLSAIQLFLKQAGVNEATSINMLEQNLSQIPSIQEIEIKTTKKTYDVGISNLGVTPSESFSPVIAGEKAQVMDMRLERFLSERGFQGIALVIDHDKTILTKGYGQEFTPDTHFPIGSLTKPITAMVVLDLLENGQFKSDKAILKEPQEVKIIDFLPKECLPSDPAVLSSWETVSLLDLLNHTSGLPSFEDLGKKIMEAKGGNIHQLVEPNQLISLILTEPLQSGSSYIYSNFGYHLLGKIIEEVSGHPYAQSASDYLSKLGLEESGYVSENTPYPSVTSWDGTKNMDVDPLRLDPPEEAYSSGGLHSTIDDLVKLLPSIKVPQTLPKAGHAKEKQYDFRQEYFCHAGWNHSDSSGKHEIWKNGAVGGFGSLFVFYPETKSAIIILSNQPADVERFIARDLSDILNAESAKTAEMNLADRASAMITEKKTAFFEEKTAVAKAYWDTYIATESDKDHGQLKRFLGDCFPDPLYIQSEFDRAIKQNGSEGFGRFFAIFNSISFEQIKQINEGEGLNALSLS